MALSFHPTTASVCGHGFLAPDAVDMTSFLYDDVHPEVSDALLGFVYDPLDDPSTNNALDELLNIPDDAADAFLGPIKDDDDTKVDQHCDKKLRATAACTDNERYGPAFPTDDDPSSQLKFYGIGGGNNQHVPRELPQFLLPLPPPLPQQQQQPPTFGAEEKKHGGGNVQSAAARERRRRISQKTAELSRLIPGGHKMSTADMLQEAGRHVKLLQAQVGVLALMHSVVGSSSEKESTRMAIAGAQEQMQALLACGSVQEWLAAESKCLVPRKLVDAVARDKAVTSNPLVNRDLARFMASLEQ